MGTTKKEESVQTGFFRNISEYFHGVISEVKKVYWPSRQQLITYTGVVFVTVTIVAFILWIVDSSLSIILVRIMPK